MATNMDDLNDAITSEAGIEVVSDPAQYREDVIQIAEQTEPEVIVLTAWLDGNMDIIDVVYQLRSLDIRVVFIAGTLTQDDLTIKRILELGVNDILFGEIRIGQVLEKIFNPTPLLQGPVDKSVVLGQKSADYAMPNYDEDTEAEGERENAFSKLAKIGGDIRKNIPSVTVPKLPKKVSAIKVLDKVVTVCSPVPTGKTFVAVNLATVIAQEGYTVALVDTDYKKFSIHTWLKCPDGEEGLSKALNNNHTDPILCAYQPDYIPGLYVFTNDPFENTPLISDKSLVLLLESLQKYVDIIIVDTPGDFSVPVTKTALNLSGTLMIVVDFDASHLKKVEKEIYTLPDEFNMDKFVVIANQLIDSVKLPFEDIEKATNMKVSCIIPNYSQIILESIKTGLPVVMFDREIKNLFEELMYSELAQAG